MAWSYDPTDLAAPVNAVRLLVGDTNPNDPLLQDEEIQGFIDMTDSHTGAAILAARSLAARFARSADKWVGDLKILNSQKHRNFLDLAEQLEEGGVGLSGVPSAGGIRYSQKEAYAANDDLVVPAFRVGLHDHPGGD